MPAREMTRALGCAALGGPATSLTASARLGVRAFAPGGPKAFPEPWATPQYGPGGKITNCGAVNKGPLGGPPAT